MSGVYPRLADFISKHSQCGEIVGDAGVLGSKGYRLWLRCACGAALDVWVTEGDAAADLVYSRILAGDN